VSLNLIVICLDTFRADLIGRGAGAGAVLVAAHFLLTLLVALLAAGPGRRGPVEHFGSAAAAMVPLMWGTLAAALLVHLSNYAAALLLAGLIGGGIASCAALVYRFALPRALAVWLVPAQVLFQIFILYMLMPEFELGGLLQWA